MDNCIFCKIVAGTIPSDKVYEDEQVLVFRDIDPKAPVHVLVVPKLHIPGVNEVTADNSAVIAHAYEVIAQIVSELGVDESGYRVVVNSGADGQQSVPHLHFHVLGGRQLAWPPG